MGTRYRGAPAEVGALNAYIKLLRAADSASAHVHRATGSGLTITQFGVLEAIYHLGPLCQIELGAKVLKSGGNMTMVVDNLEKRGLAYRQRDLGDRRRINVHLTDAGRALLDEVFPRHAATIREAMSALTTEEQAELGRLCRKLGRSLSGERPERPAADPPSAAGEPSR